MTTVFEVDMKVWDDLHFPGREGKVVDIENDDTYPIRVVFDNEKQETYMLSGKCRMLDETPSLSTTPYKVVFEGFSQEKPKPHIGKGQLIYIKAGDEWRIRFFSHWYGDMVECFIEQKKEGNTVSWSEYSIENPLK